MITPISITKEFLKENDGKIVWIRDDYLSMIGYASDQATIDILNVVINLKNKMRTEGHKFKT